jgi:hypothetical protein
VVFDVGNGALGVVGIQRGAVALGDVAFVHGSSLLGKIDGIIIAYEGRKVKRDSKSMRQNAPKAWSYAVIRRVLKKQRGIRSLCILSGEIGGHKTSAENLFSLPICVIMGLTKSLPCVKGGGSRRLTEGL